MNEVFSFSRFSRLFIKHTAEHYRTYLMATGILVGFLVLSGGFLILVNVEPDISFQMASYSIVLFVSAGLFTSSIFSEYGEKTRAVQALTLPATSFEKFLVGWLWSYPIFLVMYTAAFYLALWGLSAIQSSNGHEFAFFSLKQPQNIVLLVLFTEIHALALFGAIAFKKPQFIRTGCAFFVALGLTFLFNTFFLKILTGVEIIKLAVPFGYLNFAAGDKEYSIGRGDQTSLPILLLIFLVAVGTWVAAYYRLKEKRV